MVFVGIDWAEKHHDVCVIDQEGVILARGRVADGIEGISKLHGMVAGHIEEPEGAIVGIELDRGLLVGAPSLPATSCSPSIPCRSTAIVIATRHRDRNQILVTPRCSPTSCAPIVTTTARSPRIRKLRRFPSHLSR